MLTKRGLARDYAAFFVISGTGPHPRDEAWNDANTSIPQASGEVMSELILEFRSRTIARWQALKLGGDGNGDARCLQTTA